MKKFAITTMTLLLTSSLGICAQSASTVPVSCPVNQPCAQSPAPCAQPVMADDEEFVRERFFQARCDLYQRLCLSDSQIEQAKCLDEKYFNEAYPLKKCHCEEQMKLKEMECNGACAKDIKCQKEKVRNLHKQIKEKQKAYKESFMCILNECQKKNFKKLKKDKCDKRLISCDFDFNCPCD